MKRIIFVILMLVLLTACHRTQVVKIDAGQPTTYNIEEQTQVQQQTTEQQTTSSNVQSSIEQTTSDDREERGSETSSNSVNIVNNQSTTNDFNPANEYTIISCCEEGRLYAQTIKESQEYNENDIEEILLNIQEEECNRLKLYNVSRIYLKFKNNLQYTSFLTNYLNGLSKLQINDLIKYIEPTC